MTAALATPSRNLGPWSRRVLRALASVVMPHGDGAPEVPIDGVVDLIDDWTRYMPRLFRTLFPVGLLLLELGAFLFGPSLVPFSLMSPARRARYVDGWVHARWALRRDLIKGVKGLVLLAYYSDPQVAAFLGYTAREHAQLVAAERLKRHGHEL
jgi:hypothetical protein